MRLRRYTYFLLSCLIGFLMPSEASASHIAGGEVYYRCLGNNQYEITLNIYQDCLTGDFSAIQNDSPAYIGVFNLDDGTGQVFNNVSPSTVISVPGNFSNKCVNNPPDTCLTRVSFKIVANLPINNSGYRVSYARCCRNASTENIRDPQTTGATFFTDIPPNTKAACNNSAVFKKYPPQIICINTPLFYDHSATDADGDSLTYEFCPGYVGGNLDNPKPWPSSAIPGKVVYKSPFSATRPITGNPSIRINPSTGLITGTPTLMGRFVVTVCCNEWRNGQLINTTRREFQFVVTNCSKAVLADIPQFSDEFNTYIVECESNSIKFVNKSSGGFSYSWYFGVPGATSTDFEPTYTYPDTGVFTVTLKVNEGSTCPDSISRDVKIFPTFKADFELDGLACPGVDQLFIDKSDATFGTTTSWLWNFGDSSSTATEKDAKHIYRVGGYYNVTLAAASSKGCLDTVTQRIYIEEFVPFAGNDTIVVKGERVRFNATGGSEYTWTPADGLVFPSSPNPVGFYADTGVYNYAVHIKSLTGCEGDDSISVLVVDNPYLYVPSGFTPNGDGRNDILRPFGAGYNQIRFFRVYDRWGKLMFETNVFREGWDGTFNGQYAEIGVYYWVLKIVNRFGNDELIKGDATLLR
jgi:gliding motility-associated-like protein